MFICVSNNHIAFFICYSRCCCVYILSVFFTGCSSTLFFIKCFFNINLLIGICSSTSIFTSKYYSNFCFSSYVTFVIFCICPSELSFKAMSSCRDLIHFQIIFGCFESIWIFTFCLCIGSSRLINSLTCFFTRCGFTSVFIYLNSTFQFFCRSISTSRTFDLSSCFVWGFSIFALSFCVFWLFALFFNLWPCPCCYIIMSSCFCRFGLLCCNLLTIFGCSSCCVINCQTTVTASAYSFSIFLNSKFNSTV